MSPSDKGSVTDGGQDEPGPGAARDERLAGKGARPTAPSDDEHRRRSPKRRAAKTTPPAQWCSVEHAAAVLDIQPVTLRRAFERNARRGPSGVIEAKVDGVLARKIGRLWRVSLGVWAQAGLK